LLFCCSIPPTKVNNRVLFKCSFYYHGSCVHAITTHILSTKCHATCNRDDMMCFVARKLRKKTAVVMCCVLLSCISILFDNSLATAVDLYHLTRLILSLTRGMNLFSCLFLLSFPSVLLLTCMRHKMWSISCRTCYSSMKIRKNVYLLPFKHPSFLIMNGNETKRLLDPVIDWFLLTRMFHKLFKSLSFSLVSSSIS